MTAHARPRAIPRLNRGCTCLLPLTSFFACSDRQLILRLSVCVSRLPASPSCARSGFALASTSTSSVGHNLILAHAYACKLYREQFKAAQGGQIGITLNGDMALPYDDSPESESFPLLAYIVCSDRGEPDGCSPS